MNLSIIIVNYNTFEDTCACIDSIYNSTISEPYEIILVDNASTETTPCSFEEKYPEISLIKSQTNEGFGRANNKGMSLALGNYYLLLNSDTEVSNNNIQRSLDTLTQEKADLYSCAQYLINGTPFFYEYNSLYFGNYLKGIWYNMPFFHLSFLRPQRLTSCTVTDIIEVNTVSGAYMLLNKKVYLETKGFDPDFFLYSEETEWCYNRIREKFKIIYDPTNSFLHKTGGRFSSNMAIQQYLSKSLGVYKRGYSTYIIYLALTYLIDLPNNLIFYLISKKAYKAHYLDQAKKIIKATKYLLYDIPMYSNKFGRRTKSLILDSLQKSKND